MEKPISFPLFFILGHILSIWNFYEKINNWYTVYRFGFKNYFILKNKVNLKKWSFYPGLVGSSIVINNPQKLWLHKSSIGDPRDPFFSAPHKKKISGLGMRLLSYIVPMEWVYSLQLHNLWPAIVWMNNIGISALYFKISKY